MDRMTEETHLENVLGPFGESTWVINGVKRGNPLFKLNVLDQTRSIEIREYNCFRQEKSVCKIALRAMLTPNHTTKFIKEQILIYWPQRMNCDTIKCSWVYYPWCLHNLSKSGQGMSCGGHEHLDLQTFFFTPRWVVYPCNPYCEESVFLIQAYHLWGQW